MNYLFRVACTVVDGSEYVAQISVNVLAGSAENAIPKARDMLMGVEMTSQRGKDCVRRIIVRSVQALGKVTERPKTIAAYWTLQSQVATGEDP